VGTSRTAPPPIFPPVGVARSDLEGCPENLAHLNRNRGMSTTDSRSKALSEITDSAGHSGFADQGEGGVDQGMAMLGHLRRQSGLPLLAGKLQSPTLV
jgi:hypothetical protein